MTILKPSSDWFNLAIPTSSTTKSALDYHQIPIDLDSKGNQEPLVKVSDYGIKSRSAYAHKLAPYHHSFTKALPVPLLRETVATKLAQVNSQIKSYGVELLVLDGFRPIELQQELWDHFIEIARQIMPDAKDQELVAYVGQYWSDPRHFKEDDYRTWPTHNTGGAVDLTLQDVDTGQDLFMGSVFDDVDSVSSTRYFEDLTMTSLSALEARKNRRLLYHAMTSSGFLNYHHEWWHFDYGTQMAIMNGSQETIASYGRATIVK
ncbi:MAG: D-alanyl-D-alanine carboxypeptidase family protein [Candidatus Obscuribacter sp.]|nr:D-alanyl-D-alanine carboxypeptidase family protein [Candidatus Obscuribacter sp.]